MRVRDIQRSTRWERGADRAGMIVARRVCDVRTSHTEIAKANMPTDNDCSTQGLSLSLVDQIVFSRRISENSKSHLLFITSWSFRVVWRSLAVARDVRTSMWIDRRALQLDRAGSKWKNRDSEVQIASGFDTPASAIHSIT